MLWHKIRDASDKTGEEKRRCWTGLEAGAGLEAYIAFFLDEEKMKLNVTSENFFDAGAFREIVPEILERSGLARDREQEVWAWRARARRVGKDKVALFIWFVHNPDRAMSSVNALDEKAGKLEMNGRFQAHA